MKSTNRKIAVHNGEGYNRYLREYLNKIDIDFLSVNAYKSNIIEILRENKITHFFWHFNHIVFKDIFMARYLLFSLEEVGIKVYPNFYTSWHFDDKVAQKYLLEALNLPMVPSWSFYDYDSALSFLKQTQFPLVAKLRRGAGSYNVIKIENFKTAKSYIKRMFRSGINPAPKPLADVKNKLSVANKNGGINGIINKFKKAPRFLNEVINARREFPEEKGYAYFQKFIEGANCDYRIAMVGNKAWGSKRLVRKNDFRASGAGKSIEDPTLIPLELVELSFYLKNKLKMQSIAFDYVLDKAGKPHIVEISYCFGFDGEDGSFYWDQDLVLHTTKFDLGELLYNELIEGDVVSVD